MFGFTGGPTYPKPARAIEDAKPTTQTLPDLSSDSDFPSEPSQGGRPRRPKMPPFRAPPSRSPKVSGSESDSAAAPVRGAPVPGLASPDPPMTSIQENQPPPMREERATSAGKRDLTGDQRRDLRSMPSVASLTPSEAPVQPAPSIGPPCQAVQCPMATSAAGGNSHHGGKGVGEPLLNNGSHSGFLGIANG